MGIKRMVCMSIIDNWKNIWCSCAVSISSRVSELQFVKYITVNSK